MSNAPPHNSFLLAAECAGAGWVQVWVWGKVGSHT